VKSLAHRSSLELNRLRRSSNTSGLRV